MACVAKRNAGLRDNFAFGEMAPAEIEAMILSVAPAKPDAIAFICTNMDASRLVPSLEARIGSPVLDSIACTLWGAMDLLQIGKAPLHHAGMLFRY